MLPPKEFLKVIKPFKFLSEDELEYLIRNIEIEGFEEGEVIFKSGDRTKYVYLVFSGLVGLYDNDELVDYVSKGEIFGIGLKSGVVQFTAKAEEDTVCFLIKKDVFNQILERNEKFFEFFKSFIERRFRRFTEIARETAFEDKLLLTSVSSIISKKPVVCNLNTSIREAAMKMESNKVGSIVVVTEDMKPLGILTDNDLRRFVIRGKSLDESVSSYMSSPPICIDSDRPLFEAYIELLRRGINHLIVTENDRVVGVITGKDILAQFEPSTSLIALYRKIRKATTVEELKETFNDLKRVIATLVMKGLHFYDLSTMLTGLYDYVTTAVIEIVKEEFGNLPKFLWVHMGSSARKEQVIATDQDNAIIHEGQDDVLLEFARRVNEALNEIGIPKCSGNYMASNPKWNRELDDWKDMFKDWFLNLTPKNVRFLSIFLDMRPIYGEFKFYDELIEFIHDNVTMQAVRYLARDATTLEPPSGIFGLRKLKEINLKRFAIYPIVNGVRVLALDNRILHITNTKERIEKLMEIGVVQESVCKELIESYEFLQDLRLKRQSQCILENKSNGNTVRIEELERIEILVLKECFKIISNFQKLLRGRYIVGAI